MPKTDFAHAVIGAGAVGLSISRRLALRGTGPTLLLERNSSPGMETSSRNSEVIHAGLYYGPSSLKTRLCIRGKELLYSLCSKHTIPHRRCGKWIVAQNDAQMEELGRIHELSKELGVETRFLGAEETSRLERDVTARVGVLESPSTGILDSHAYMTYLHGAFEDAGGDTVLNTTVTNIQPISTFVTPGSEGWEVTTKDSHGEEMTITAEVLINSAGLGAVDIQNMVMPKQRQRKMYFAKGNYFSYAHSTPRSPSRLIYPAPEPGLGGLGTHLTFDLAGRIRFGPDVEWVDSPSDLSVNSSRLPQAVEQIHRFMPGIEEKYLEPDYAGIRPKLSKGGAVAATGKGTKGKGFVDFYIEKEEGFEGFVNLLGIESPGLTSSLAIGEEVERLVYGDVRGD